MTATRPLSEATADPRCANCGSESVVKDAWACWDPETRSWTLDAVFDHSHCLHCGASTTLEWAPTHAGPEIREPAR
jgi:hypothetical protein